MYDKVKMWLDRTIVGEQLSYIPNYLDEATTHYTHKTGEERVSGSLGGLRVVVGVNGLPYLAVYPSSYTATMLHHLTDGQLLK